MAGARRKCLVEVEKPGVLVVMEDMLDQVLVEFFDTFPLTDKQRNIPLRCL